VSTPFASIGGIASGLDTANIIQSLLSLERRPMQLLQAQQAKMRQADDAWGSVVTKLSTLRTATNGLTDPTWLDRTATATSSSDSVARVRATGAVSPGALSFQVDALAARHQAAYATTFGAATATVGAGTLTVTVGGTERSVTLGEGATLQDAARALDGLEGVSARTLRTGTDQYRLVVTADASGADAAFTLGGDVAALGASTTLVAGQDAQLSLGSLVLHRSSNTIDDLIDGVSIELAGVGTTTVTVGRDTDAAVKRVTDYVAALNGVLDQLATVSRTSAEAGSRGVLAGDPAVRSLSLQLRSTLSQVVGEGEFASLSAIGLTTGRDGRIALDATKLRAAMTADPAAVGQLLGRSSSATVAGVEVTGTGRAQAGTYGLQLDTAATVATRTGAPFVPPTEATTFSILTPEGRTVEITLDETHTDAASAVAAINAALGADDVTQLRASVDATDGSISLVADRAGARRTFTVSGSGGLGLDGTTTGTDAAGTLTDAEGTAWALTGTGASLSAGSDGPLRGLTLRVPIGAVGAQGSVTVADGFASVVDRVLRTAEGSEGSVSRARNALKGRIDNATRSIEAFEDRLAIRERTIRAQFTALESAMARMGSQASWLASQLGSMQQ
jgi:flagellar hook-associated protein 2